MSGARRLAVIFAITIALPGSVLLVFGFRALLQERRVRDQQIRDNLAVSAEGLGHQLDAELSKWQETATRIAAGDWRDQEHWPALLRGIAAGNASGVVITGSRERPEVLPAGRLLYELSPSHGSAEPPHSSPLFAQAQSLELRDKKYSEAISLYRKLLTMAAPGERPYVLHGLARSLKKNGESDDAARVFGLLEKERPVRIGSLPSDLIARYEILSLESESKRRADALDFYSDLVRGRWQLEYSSYGFYSQQVREWTSPSPAEHELAAEENVKLSLTQATERMLRESRPFYVHESAAYIGFSNVQPFALAVVSGNVLNQSISPDAQKQNLRYSLLAPSGEVLAGEVMPKAEAGSTFRLQNSETGLKLQVWPENPEALYAAANQRQNIYWAMLVVVAALLCFGGYVLVRTMWTELAVAQMKSDFAATVSHEFRSPLAGINQLAEMLRDDRVPDEARRQLYYEMIVGETQRLRRLVENILDFSRMENGRKQYRLEPLDETAEWLRGLAEDFQAEVASTGFVVEARIPEKLPAIVADRAALATAVHNLLDNAVKYSRDSRIAWLYAASRDGHVLISVRDRGMGIRDEDRPRVFEKFYRGGQATHEVKGVGLGLNLVKHIVTAHGGVVEFESKENEGSTFTIHLNVMRPA